MCCAHCAPCALELTLGRQPAPPWDSTHPTSSPHIMILIVVKMVMIALLFHFRGNMFSDGFVHGLEVMVSTMLRGTGTRPKKMQHAVCDECRFDKGLVTRTLQSLSIFPHSGLEDRITDGQCLTHRRRWNQRSWCHRRDSWSWSLAQLLSASILIDYPVCQYSSSSPHLLLILIFLQNWI